MAYDNFINLLDRRVELKKPTTVRAAGSNESELVYESVVKKLPAGRPKETASGGKEDLEMNSALRAETDVEWVIRYFGSNHPRANWRLIDEYGTTHDIISPPTEIGRRKGWALKTRIVQ